MFYFIGLLILSIGLIGIIIFGIMAVFSIVKKNGKAKRNLIIIGISSLLFIIGASTLIGGVLVEEFLESETEEEVSNTENNLVDEKSELYSMHSMEYSIPESWTENISNENLRYYYPEDGMLMFSYDELSGTVSNDELRADYIYGVSSTSDSFDLISESEVSVAGTKAYQYNFTSVVSNEEYKFSLFIFDYYDGVMALNMGTLLDSEKDYSSEFESILSSVEFIDEDMLEEAKEKGKAEKEERIKEDKKEYEDLDFKQLDKNPDKHSGELVKYSGSIVQIIEGENSSDIRLGLGEHGRDIIYIYFDDVTDFVQDDQITVYGKVEGSYTYDTTIGGQMTVPLISADIIE